MALWVPKRLLGRRRARARVTPLTSGPKAWFLFGQISKSHHCSSSSGIPCPVVVGTGVSRFSEESSRGSMCGFGWSTSLWPSAPPVQDGDGKVTLWVSEGPGTGLMGSPSAWGDKGPMGRLPPGSRQGLENRRGRRAEPQPSALQPPPGREAGGAGGHLQGRPRRGSPAVSRQPPSIAWPRGSPAW